MTTLTSDIGQMGGAIASLRDDVSGVRSGLGSLRQTVDTAPENKGTAQANAGGTHSAAPAAPRNATTSVNLYWAMRPSRPW